ncbi:MAG: EAL domain-containing protein [Snowella sp.]|nr:EAL domain-containing protein [Snowella sp.]
MKLPIRQVLIFTFAFEIFIAVGIISFLSNKFSQIAINNIAEEWRSEVGNRIQNHVKNFLDNAQLMNQVNKNYLIQGDVTVTDLSKIQKFLYQQMQSFRSVPYTAWGSETGDYVGIARTHDNQYQVEIVSKATKGEYQTYQLNPDGTRGKLLKVFPNYDPRLRPWYQQAIKAQEATWTPIYLWFDSSRIALDTVLPVYDVQGKKLGVLDTPITLSNISDFLSQLKISPSGKSFILDGTGEIIASSEFELDSQIKNPSLKTLLAAHGKDSTIRETAAYFNQKYPNLSEIKSPFSFAFEGQNQRNFVRVIPFRDRGGIDWLIGVVIPEKDFMEIVWANNRLTLIVSMIALFVAIGVGIFTARWITDPILKINQASKAIAAGELDQKVDLYYNNEIGDLANSFNLMAAKLKQVFQELEFKTLHDYLTGLSNRVQLMERLAESLEQSQRNSDLNFALFFLDLDDFKVVNDSLGHLVGDALLKQVSHRIRTCVRPSDCVARFGGDEFVILVENIDEIANIDKIAQRILTQLNYPFNLENHQLFVTVSIGITISSIGYSKPEDILRDADIAMYYAKQQGKSRYQIMTSSLQIAAMRRFQLERELRDAVKKGEFCLFYQPIICLKTGELSGFEALIRWKHPIHGLISPGEFIPIAEETSLIKVLDLWVLEAACQQMSQWQEQIPFNQILSMSVNFSPIELIQQNIVEVVENIVQKYSFDWWDLKLEITENALMDSVIQVEILENLKKLNLKLSLDDFGTGYSSLSRLYRFPIDTLKIDRSFVTRIQLEKAGASIINAIVTLAHNLQMDVVAEGIETILEQDTLKNLGCEFGQGYLFAKPLNLEAATELIKDSQMSKKRSFLQKI